MIKYKKTILHKTFALALAAAISVTAAGCSGGAHTSSSPPDAPQAATQAAAVPSEPAAETAAAEETAKPAETAAAAASTAAAAAAEADTAMKDSVLSEALVECTGWGQSAGSSLRAAAASVMLLQWANEVDAANLDSEVLANTVKAEVSRLSDDQQENLKENWSSISFDASMILDSYDEIAPVLEDAGCAEAAKNLSGSKNTLANWEAAEHALNAVLK